jgi:acid phosphatase (class A)
MPGESSIVFIGPTNPDLASAVVLASALDCSMGGSNARRQDSTRYGAWLGPHLPSVSALNCGKLTCRQMRRFLHVIAALFASGLVAWTQPAAAPARVPGYLTAAQTSGVLRIVPPAPLTGDPRFQADMAIFHDTRSLEGSPRWKLAQSDDNLSLAGLLRAFACSLGLSLTPENAPRIARLINRANEDAYTASDVIKKHYNHKRPFQVADGGVCLSPKGKAALERSPDYPSGHTTLSWETGLILAELDPPRAIDVLARARAFGQSRVVCGVHDLSAVEAGWMTASAVFAMQMDSPEFRKDLDAARMEFSALTGTAKAKTAECQAEAHVLATAPY